MPTQIPSDPFGRVRAPTTFDRAGRIRLVGVAATALATGQPVPREAAAFLGGAILAWLDAGGRVGDLEREHLRVTGPERSRKTPGRVWASCCARTAQGADDFETIEPSALNEDGSL